MTRNIEDLQIMALKHGWQLNPDAHVVATLLKRQNLAFEKNGNYFCPCKIEKIAKNVCPCQSAESEIAEKGKCHCQLFVRNR